MSCENESYENAYLEEIAVKEQLVKIELPDIARDASSVFFLDNERFGGMLPSIGGASSQVVV